jgi:PAS domain S-box-containing protein
MSTPFNKILLLERNSLLILTLGIFFLDSITPLSLSIWLLYLLPLTLVRLSPSERDPYYLAMVVTWLMGVGWWVSPWSGIEPKAAAINRLIGVGVIWVSTWMVVRHQKTNKALLKAESARLQAETLRDTALEARESAETTLTGALHLEAQATRESFVSNLRLQGIVQSAMDAILTVDERQQVLLFNEAAERMFGCLAREALGQSLERFIPSRFHTVHRQHIERFGRSDVTSRKMGQLGTVMALRADGEEFPVEAAISHITVEGKKYYTVILRDITERKQAEQLLSRNEERYRQLIAASPLAIVVYRADKVILINDAGLKLFGAVTQSEILGKSHFDLFHPDSHALIRERIQLLLDGSTTVPVVEEKILTLDGRIVEVEVNKAKFIDEEGPAILAMIRDISERSRLQEQLRKTERIAELGTLASGMAHEIGTPMNVILGRAEYLMQRTQEEPLKKGLQTIITQVERITKVMNQLLAFARRKPPEGRAVDLVQTIEDSLEIFQERMVQSRITVEKVVEANIPLVHADRDQLIQVLINLVTNSLHAMPDGGRLRLSLSHEHHHVCLGVSDTGHGMPEDIRSKIFEPFFTTKDFGKGTGLGLTVVKGIIEECGGTIAVESAVDKGTTFWIRLPLEKAQHATMS